jgi:hypothetical protein
MQVEVSHVLSNWRLVMVVIRVLAVALLSLIVLGAAEARADFVVVSPPTVAYYYPPPTVTYYSPPVVYAPAPTTTYYYTPVPSYYAVPAAVATTRYGWFGRPRVTTYYPPVYFAR